MTDASGFYFDPAAPIDERLIPDGWCKAVVSSAFYKETKKGKLLKVVHELTEGEYTGKLIDDLFFLGHHNHKAVWHAKRKLQSLCIAAGIQKPVTHESELIGAETKILIGRSTWGDEEKNEVKEYACVALMPSAPIAKKKTDGPVSNHGARKLYIQEDFPAPPPLSADDDNIPF